MSNTHCLDLTLLNGYLESLGAEVLGKMLAMYEQQSAIYIDAIEETLQEGAQETWHQSCHKMKGAAASAGFASIRQLLIEMEKSTADVTEKSLSVEKLKNENRTDIALFKQWLAEQG